MFCKENNPFTTIQMGHFASETIIKDDVSTSNDILSQVEEVMSFIKKHINKEIIITEKVENIQRWQYPLEGIRELVLNMIIHRDYTSPADSVVKIFTDHVIFFNPGKLPDNITIEKLLADDYISSPRNRQIAKMAKEMGWIEKYGTGIKRVCKLFTEYKLPIPVFKTVQGGFFVKVKGLLPATQKTTLETTQKTTSIILELIKQNPNVTRKQIARLLGTISQDGVKYHLDKLRKEGILTRIGSTKGGHWQVNQ